MERLTPEDASFLRIEDEISAMHSVSLAVFAGDEPPFTELVERVGESVALVPRCRQRVVEIPFDLGRPVWLEDPNFALDYHVRHTGLPDSGGEHALANLAGRILSQRLDRGKPLWELWIVSGLPDGRWAVLSKSHHAMVDGVSGTDPLAVVLDQSRRGSRSGDPWRPEPMPSPVRLGIDALTDLAINPIERYRLARQTVVRPRRALRAVRAAVEPEPAAKAIFGPIGTHRRWRGIEIDRARLDAVVEASGGSTGAAVFALVCAGFRSVLASAATMPDTIETLVPFASTTGSMAAPGTFRIKLPVGESDPLVRLERLAAASSAAGWTHVHPHGFTTPTAVALGARTLTRHGRREPEAQTVTVIAGTPMEPLSLLGRRLERTHPVLPLPARVRIATGAYLGPERIWFGVTGSFEAETEVDRFCVGLEEGLAELEAAVAG